MLKAARIKGTRSLYAGLIYIAIGSAAVIGGRSYDMGTALQMGPGFFPALVGAILVLLGIGSIIAGLLHKTPDPVTVVKLEPLLLIFAGTLSFALLIGRVGLVVAIAVLLFFACFRRLWRRPLEVLAIFVGLTAFSVLVFIYGFGMQMNAFWWQQ